LGSYGYEAGMIAGGPSKDKKKSAPVVEDDSLLEFEGFPLASRASATMLFQDVLLIYTTFSVFLSISSAYSSSICFYGFCFAL